jgi:hypothetical protein
MGAVSSLDEDGWFADFQQVGTKERRRAIEKWHLLAKDLRSYDSGVPSQLYHTNTVLDFPVEKYSGTKSILISTRTVMGGKNPFLGIAYLVVGGLCIILGAVFLATHLIKPR